MEKSEYREAYAEVIQVLNYVPIEAYNKIPKKFITFLEENYDENSSFTYNIALPLNKQNLSDTAKNVLAVIYRLFWTNEQEKTELNKLDMEKKREEKEKFNPERMFEKKEKIEEIKDSESENKLDDKYEFKHVIVYEEKNWFKKMISKIKNLFKKK